MSPTVRRVILACWSTATATFIACGSGADAAPPSSVGSGGGGASGGLGGAAGGASATGGAGTTGFDAGNPDANEDAGCFGVSEKGQSTPLHLYVLMDKSSSMSGFKWEAAKAGLSAFVSDPSSDGVAVALKFFPRPPGGPGLCDQHAYATPDTPFAPLPGNRQALLDAIAAAAPSGLTTPTWPALGGGLLAGIEVAQNNPGHSAAVLLVTDGVPQGPADSCAGVDPTSTSEIAKLAAAGAAFSPPVRTFVVGLPGVDQTFANTVAQAGGTASAILVSSTNVEQEFRDALATVRGEALPCEYQLPSDVSSGKYDTAHVNVELGSSGGKTQLASGDCAKGGDWSYDDPKNPTKIVLCPSVCDSVKHDFQATISVVLGCLTLVK